MRGTGDLAINVTFTNRLTSDTSTIVLPANASPEECAKLLKEGFSGINLIASATGNKVTVMGRVNRKVMSYKIRYRIRQTAEGTGIGPLDIQGPISDFLRPKPTCIRIGRGAGRSGAFVSVQGDDTTHQNISVVGIDPNERPEISAIFLETALKQAGINARTSNEFVEITSPNLSYNIRLEGLEGTVNPTPCFQTLQPRKDSTSPNPQAQQVQVESVLVSPSTIALGGNATLTVRLSHPAPTGGITVGIAIDSNGTWQTLRNTPISFRISQGQREITDNLQTERVNGAATRIIFCATTGLVVSCDNRFSNFKAAQLNISP